MRAYRIHDYAGLEAFRREELSTPKPGPGQALVRIHATSLNYRDLLVAKGLYSRQLPLPLVPLSDGAGEVVEVGPGVTRVKPGDRVAPSFMQAWIEGGPTEEKAKSALGGAIDGVLAELVVLGQDGLVAVPDHLSFEEAATLPCAAVTAWHALFGEGSIKPGDTVLVQGTGGVSLFALQFARMAGARVIATSSSDEKLERVRALGASDGINYKTTPDWDRRARELTGGRGVDHVVEVGGAGTLPRSLNAVRMGGRISQIGILSGAGEVNPIPILMKSVHVQGIFVGSRAMFEDMNRAIGLSQLRPVIDRVFDFDEARDALRHMESGAHFGKIVIRV
ncbi:MAG: NAD(P)-dependent alcohol dehydrogenase [Planctomycetaceae bacterium]|nr:NAD(P)-dependent alcohol dehydrogenase [Planctomycetaceae bacterium]